MLYQFNHNHLSPPPECVVPSDLDFNEKILFLIEFMIPHLEDYQNPTNPSDYGAQFVYFEKPLTKMSGSHVCDMMTYLSANEMIRSYDITNDIEKAQAKMARIDAFSLSEILKDFCRQQRKPRDTGPQR